VLASCLASCDALGGGGAAAARVSFASALHPSARPHEEGAACLPACLLVCAWLGESEDLDWDPRVPASRAALGAGAGSAQIWRRMRRRRRRGSGSDAVLLRRRAT